MFGKKDKGTTSKCEEKVLVLTEGTAGKKLRIQAKELGKGAQALVYLVPEQDGRPKRAAKIFPVSTPEQQAHIKKATKDPFWKDLPACRPEEWFVTEDGQFGYIMAHKGEGFLEYNEIMQAQQEGTWGLTALCRACYELAEIHAYAYKHGMVIIDFSERNLSIDPELGLVSLFDVENWMTEDEVRNKDLFVCGSHGSMAPELLLGQTKPNKATCNFALASVIFQLFMGQFPYDGAASLVEIANEEYRREYHGEHPVFAFSERYPDAAYPKNKETAGLWKYWNDMIHPKLKALFIRAFEDGAKAPERRPKPEEWMAVFSEISRQIAYCPECRNEFFVDGSEKQVCPECQKTVNITYLTARGKNAVYKIPMYKNMKLSPCQLFDRSNRRREFCFHNAILPLAQIGVNGDNLYLVNLDRRRMEWDSGYGSRKRPLAHGHGNPLRNDLYAVIPMASGDWELTV